MEEVEGGWPYEKDPNDVPHMSMESVGNIDFFKCNKCPFMALTAKDIQFHWQISHSKNYKIPDTKSITVKCPGCSGIFYSEISLKTHLRSHHKMCAKDINKLVQNLIQQFKRNQEYIENMEVVIDSHSDVNQNAPLLIEVPPDPKVVIVNNNPPINVINIGGSTTNFIFNTNNGIDNSDPYIGNTKTFLAKNMDVLTTASSHKQSGIINNNCLNTFNIITPNTDIKQVNKVENINTNMSSILYNKLKNADCVSNILALKSASLPTIQGKVNGNVTDFVTTNKSTYNKIKTSLCYKKESDIVTLSNKRDDKTDYCLKSTQKVMSKEWIVTLPTNGYNSTIPQSNNLDVINNMSAANIEKNQSNESNNLFHETPKYQNSVTTDNNGCLDKSLKITNQINENCNSKSGNKSRRVNSNKRKVFHANFCGISDCSVRLMAEDKLNYHRSCHINNTKDLYCPECKIANFTTHSSLHHHLWKIHNVDLELYTCDICQHKTVNKNQLSYHILIHSNDKKYVCETCSKAFINSKQLSTHRTTHRKAISFTCEICNMDLRNARQLSSHKKTIHEKKKNFHCDLCQYSSATKDALRLHMIRHIGTKHLKCPECNFKTGDRNVFRRHRQRHTNEKTYSCEYCSYTCIQAASLKSHLTSKHSDNKDNLMFSCPQCSFTTFSRQKLKNHLSAHKDGTLKPSLVKSQHKVSTKNKRRSKIKASDKKQKSENVTPIVETDMVIEVTDQNSTSTHLNMTSDDNTNIIVSDSNGQFSCVVESSTEAAPIQIVDGYVQKDNSHFFSNIINSLSSIAGNEMYTSNNIHEGLFDLSNKIESVFDSNSESTHNCINKNDVGYDSSISMMSYNPMFSSNHQNNYVISNIDTDDNDTNYYANYDSNLVINEEIPSSENTTNFSICVADNATDGLSETNHNNVQTVDITTAEKSYKTDSVKVNSNIFVKDILDLAASHIKTIPPNVYASDIQKSASHTPIILINPKTQTNNRIMGANIFSSNIINPSYSETSSSSQMLHIPLQPSNVPANNSLPRKKPKISVKSNLILKGPDRLDNFDLRSGKSIEYNINNTPYSLDNYSLPMDFITNNQTIENDNMNCSSDLLSKDLYNSEHNYLSNYLLNSDFPLPNVQAPIISNNTTIIQNSVNSIQTIPLETNLTDMSDVKLENKPYLSNQSEAMISNLMGNTVHNSSNMFYDVPIHVPIKFEQKMDMLSSYANQNNTVFQDDPNMSTATSPVVEEIPQTFENINTGYNQSLYPFEDNYYFENDFITETLDGQEIIVLNDTWSDVKSLPSNNEYQFDQSTQLAVNVNELPGKEKPRIISEVHITGNTCSSNLSNLGDVKKIGLPFEFPLVRNTFSDFSSDQQDVIFDSD